MAQRTYGRSPTLWSAPVGAKKDEDIGARASFEAVSSYEGISLSIRVMCTTEQNRTPNMRILVSMLNHAD